MRAASITAASRARLITWARTWGGALHFADRLSRLCSERGPLCAGIDPRPERLPPGLDAVAWGEEACRLLSARVAAIKPQLAFFDDAWEAVERLAPAARAGGALLVADAKRGDIGSTAEAYAQRILERSPADAVTLNPYLGGDSLAPWIDAAARLGKGLFVLVKTSNPGSADLQDLRLEGGETVCERVARLVHRLGEDLRGPESGRSLLGAVVGLTAPPEFVARLRALMPYAFFLLPGYGAQGGDPRTLEAARDERGGGVLVSASRSLTLPWQGAAPTDWPDRIERALLAMRNDLRA
ncbi:MAG: orotidine-5'-phosphate decarboxylase [Planctomycetota bacterium]|nr:MAG: orotidine-5'-phosphate decarboxylase [Planctomycetota bacterium]